MLPVCEKNLQFSWRIAEKEYAEMVKHLDVKATSNREADVHFYGKGKKHRITPLSREIWNQFEDYCEKYHPDKTSENLLFYSFRNGPRNKMSSDNVSRIFAGCEEEDSQKHPDLIHLHSHLFRGRGKEPVSGRSATSYYI